jgi:hypothetical protein
MLNIYRSRTNIVQFQVHVCLTGTVLLVENGCLHIEKNLGNYGCYPMSEHIYAIRSGSTLFRS